MTKDTNVGASIMANAASKGHLKEVKRCLDMGVDPNGTCISEHSALSLACASGHEQVVELLLARGANPNGVLCNNIEFQESGDLSLHMFSSGGFDLFQKRKKGCRGGMSSGLLHIASKKNDADIVKLLLKFGATIDLKNKTDATTPLHTASCYGHDKIAQILLDNGADIAARDKYEQTSLHHACKESHVDAVKLLLSRGANIDDKDIDGKTPLQVSVHGSIRSMLLNSSSSSSYYSKNHHQQYYSEVKKTDKDIHNLKVKPSRSHTKYRYPAERTTQKYVLDSVKLQPSRGASNIGEDGKDIEDWKTRPLPVDKQVLSVHGSIRQSRMPTSSSNQTEVKKTDKDDIYNLMVNPPPCPPDINYRERYPMINAVLENNMEDVEKYLNIDAANIDDKDSNEWTGLMHAVCRGYKRMVELLLKRGADTNTQIKSAQNPLALACYHGHECIVLILLQNAVNLDAGEQAPQKYSALHMACHRGHERIVKLLLRCGANVDAKDKKDETPLDKAVFFKHKTIVKMMLTHKKVPSTAGRLLKDSDYIDKNDSSFMQTTRQRRFSRSQQLCTDRSYHWNKDCNNAKLQQQQEVSNSSGGLRSTDRMKYAGVSSHPFIASSIGPKSHQILFDRVGALEENMKEQRDSILHIKEMITDLLSIRNEEIIREKDCLKERKERITGQSEGSFPSDEFNEWCDVIDDAEYVGS